MAFPMVFPDTAQIQEWPNQPWLSSIHAGKPLEAVSVSNRRQLTQLKLGVNGTGAKAGVFQFVAPKEF